MMLQLFKTTAIAFAMTTVACGNGTTASNNKTPDSSLAATNNRAAQDTRLDTAVSVTGCLQQDGRTFIVTHRNEPAQKNAGSVGNGTAVEREQLRSAANAYRLSPAKGVDLDKLVGKQVQVSGTIDKPATLPGAAGSSAQREDIGKGDLAEIKTDAVTVVADNCGGADARK